jgi:hypothetical protein
MGLYLMASGIRQPATSPPATAGTYLRKWSITVDKHEWKDRAACLGFDTNIFFDKYEEEEAFRPGIDSICHSCPVIKQCFAVGISQKEWGVWGGIYLENGKISREFSKHRSKEDWAESWKALTMDKKETR